MYAAVGVLNSFSFCIISILLQLFDSDSVKGSLPKHRESLCFPYNFNNFRNNTLQFRLGREKCIAC